jgi:antitoxin (DNA-binding transcriptional repressor) of toxin-antitoxin stability system
MVTKHLDVASISLSDVLQLVDEGQEVVLMKDAQAVARITPLSKKRIAGLHEGSGGFWMSDDFDAPLSDFDFDES